MKSELMKNSDAKNPIPVPDTLEIMPLVDIEEKPEGFELFFEIPGVDAEHVTIEVANAILSICAESSLMRNHRRIVFKRKFQLANSVEVDKIGAKTADGVLTLHIPKAPKDKVHRIAVGS